MVTLKDVAKKTGYTINTVSCALNGKGRISKDTRELICKCAEEMGYIPNMTAQKMRTGKSRLIALIVDDLLNPTLSKIVYGIILSASYNDYDVVVYTVCGDEKKEKKAIRSALSRNVDGFLISPLNYSEENINIIKESGIPYILLGRKVDEFGEEPCITYDDLRAGFIAAEHLILNGHKSLAFFNSERHVLSGTLRLTGIRAAVQMYGGQLREDKIFNVPLNVHNHLSYFSKIESKLDDITGIICYDDLIAYEVVSHFKSIGKSVPEDVSVIGFGSVSERMRILPQLTTVASDDSVMSLEAVAMLLKKINGEEIEDKVMAVSLIEGESVKKIN